MTCFCFNVVKEIIHLYKKEQIGFMYLIMKYLYTVFSDFIFNFKKINFLVS